MTSEFKVWGVGIGQWDWPLTGAHHVPEEDDQPMTWDDLPKADHWTAALRDVAEIVNR